MNKMKVIALVALLAVSTLLLSGCSIGNRQIGFDTTQSFRWAIVELGNGELIEGQVTAWRDFNESDVVQFTLDDGITYLTHYSKVILCTQKP